MQNFVAIGSGVSVPQIRDYDVLHEVTIQGGPKKVSHYRESSLNRIKNRQPG